MTGGNLSPRQLFVNAKDDTMASYNLRMEKSICEIKPMLHAMGIKSP